MIYFTILFFIFLGLVFILYIFPKDKLWNFLKKYIDSFKNNLVVRLIHVGILLIFISFIVYNYQYNIRIKVQNIKTHNVLSTIDYNYTLCSNQTNKIEIKINDLKKHKDVYYYQINDSYTRTSNIYLVFEIKDEMIKSYYFTTNLDNINLTNTGFSTIREFIIKKNRMEPFSIKKQSTFEVTYFLLCDLKYDKLVFNDNLPASYSNNNNIVKNMIFQNRKTFKDKFEIRINNGFILKLN